MRRSREAAKLWRRFRGVRALCIKPGSARLVRGDGYLFHING